MSDRVEFKREIGLFMAVMIGIGAMMGPGIFALPGELAKMVGPLGVVVYLAMGAVVIFTALNYAELGAALPIAGGGYSFVSRTLPKPIAFLTGWFFWIGNVAACAMYVVIFALTIRAYFWPEANVALIALVATGVFAAINLRGMSQALMVIIRSPMLAVTAPMKPSISSMLANVAREVSRIWSAATSSRGSSWVTENAPGACFFPVCTATEVPNRNGPISNGCTITFSPIWRGTVPESK